jgi:hypothetical protein
MRADPAAVGGATRAKSLRPAAPGEISPQHPLRSLKTRARARARRATARVPSADFRHNAAIDPRHESGPGMSLSGPPAVSPKALLSPADPLRQRIAARAAFRERVVAAVSTPRAI